MFVLYVGDVIIGMFYFILFGGLVDVVVMNVGNFYYFMLGNYEFDVGNEGLLKFFELLKIFVLFVNVIFDKSFILYNKWKFYDIFIVNGEKIGIIGLDIVNKIVNLLLFGKDVKFYDEVVIV